MDEDVQLDPVVRRVLELAQASLGAEPVGAPAAAADQQALGDRDEGALRGLEVLARGIAEDRATQLAARRGADADRHRVQRLLDDPSSFGPVYQPVVELGSGRLTGYEALTRFADGTPPDVVFATAARCGLGPQLEAAAVSAALAGARRHGVGVPVWVNLSPSSLAAEPVRAALLDADPHRLVVEITEHAAVEDYELLNDHLAVLREHGVRVAVDDAGAGFASLQHVLRLRPDAIKLDMGLIRGIDADPARQALAHSLIAFGRSIGSQVLAEGIETPAELDALHRLDVDLGQGFLLARPGPLAGPLDAAPRFPRPAPRRRGDRDGVLGRIVQAAATETELEPLVRALLVSVVEVTELDTAYLTVLTDGDVLDHRYVHNAGEIRLPEGLQVAWDDSLCQRCQNRGMTWTHQVGTDLPGVPGAERLGLQTFLSIPMVDGTGALIGTLCCASSRAQFVPAQAVDQVRLCAQLIQRRLLAPAAGPPARLPRPRTSPPARVAARD